MRVLHLLSAWKWTGPAEPALEAAALLARRPGLEVVLAHSSRSGRDMPNQVGIEAARLGLATLPGLDLPKHFRPVALLRDAARLARRLGSFDLLHCHMPGDHLLAWLARRLARRPVPVVRSWYAPEGPATLRERLALSGATAGAIVPGERARRRVEAWSRGRVRAEVLLPPLDLERFDPARPGLRDAYCYGPEHCVLGVVARMQPHRCWELLLESFGKAVQRNPGLRLLVVGRGPDWERLVLEPARRAGLAGRLVLAGYRRGEDFAGTLRAMDALVFLVPGSDGTCRALRQAQAAGLPAIVSRRGLLPELVADGRTGWVTAEEPEALAEAMGRLASDREAARRMGRAARAAAVESQEPGRFAARVEALYRTLIREAAPCAG